MWIQGVSGKLMSTSVYWIFYFVNKLKGFLPFGQNMYSCFQDFSSLHIVFHFFCMSSFWTPFVEECPFPIIYSCLLCPKLIEHMCMGLFLGSLFCFTGLWIWFYVSVLVFWLPQLCSIVWNQVVWYFWLCSSFSMLLFWLFRVFCGSIHILELFVLVLWQSSLEF